jgi:hypothetical protein
VPEDVLTFGREQYENALDVLARCEESGKWPGVAPDAEVELRLPLWAAPDLDEEPLDDSTPIEDVAF